ncbi:SOS response-associated peptidase [Halorarum halobium]|uniref:SOS response-associated peptidase n=1 Tax=Halorarum halobium TaxID=3075121 RepID=UPI0028B10F3F|nr:SOS response-associated peptidase [Halobaculum sp. XH14]
MCGRFSLYLPPAALESRFEAEPPADLQPRYNCAPGQSLPVLAADDTGRMRRMKWGFTPSWADESFDLINARVETVREKRSFTDAYESRRCLVPADGFYEWTRRDGGKWPYRVSFADDRPFAMAGLYETWTPPTRQAGIGEFGRDEPTGEERVEAFTVLTTEPNDLVSELHDRMAVVLRPEHERAWLDGFLDHETLATPISDDEFRAYPVSTRVNSPANDDPSLVEPVELGS